MERQKYSSKWFGKNIPLDTLAFIFLIKHSIFESGVLIRPTRVNFDRM